MFECLAIRRLLHVEHGLMFNSQILGDRQGILGRVSMRVVIDGDVAHDRSYVETAFNHLRFYDRS